VASGELILCTIEVLEMCAVADDSEGFESVGLVYLKHVLNPILFLLYVNDGTPPTLFGRPRLYSDLNQGI
jgi:hypothetical protein